MNIEEILKRNAEIEKGQKIHQEVMALYGKTNVEKLKFFGLISNQRIEDIKKIHFKDCDFLEWEEKENTLNDVEIETLKIVGTWHPDYKDKSLYKALNSLKKFNGVLSQYITNPNYYYSNETRTTDEKKLNLIYKESEDRYYIDGHANNRFITILAMGIKSVLVNTIVVYKENKQLKKLYQWMEKNNFNFYISSDKATITIESDYFYTILYNKSIEDIEDFINKYEKLNISNLKIRLYKLRTFLNYCYKDKYKYIDDITHLFHNKYIELREHKLHNS